MSNGGLEFKIGVQFRILESDKDAILVEKIGDNSRIGAIRGGSQVYNPMTKLWIKREDD